ncbi:MAG: Crp/Fnr family transcriptional regulator [Pseudomonadales bacterium]
MKKQTIDNSYLRNDCVLFYGLNDNELAKLATIAQSKELKSSQYLFHQHTPADEVYSVISGSALIERTLSSGQRQILSFLSPGHFVGLTNSDYLEYSVKSLECVKFCMFNKKQLLAMADELPSLKSNIRQVSANVLALALDQACILGKKKSHERLCYLLMQLIEVDAGATLGIIDLSMTREDIADYLGLTVETVSRAFSRLKQMGLISIPSPQRVQILFLEEVRLLACLE